MSFVCDTDNTLLPYSCVCLLGELAQHAQTDVATLLPQLLQAVSHQHYTQHVILLETLCKQVCALLSIASVLLTCTIKYTD